MEHFCPKFNKCLKPSSEPSTKRSHETRRPFLNLPGLILTKKELVSIFGNMKRKDESLIGKANQFDMKLKKIP